MGTNYNAKTMVTILFAILISFSNSVDAAKRKTKRKQKQIKIEQVIENIDTLFANKFVDEMSDSILLDTKDAIVSYLNKIEQKHKNIERGAIYTHYYDNMLELSDSCENNIAQYKEACYKFLVLDAPLENNIAYEGCLDAYIAENNIEGIKKTLQRYELYSTDCAGMYDDIIANYKYENRYLLDPTLLEKEMKGYWVSVSHVSNSAPKMNFPYSIIEIKNLNANNGVKAINVPGVQDYYKFGDVLPQYSNEFYCDIDYILFGFNASFTNLGNAEFAKSGFESTRQFRANMKANINNSKANFGTKLGASMATEITANLFDIMFMNSAVSTQTNEIMFASLEKVSPSVLKGPFKFYSYNVNTYNYNYTPRPTFNSNITYVKWNKEDSVYFISSSEKLVSPFYNTEANIRLNSIKEKYSWKQPKYLIPVVAAEVVGAGLVAWGISSIIEDKLALGIISAVCGYSAMLTVPLVTHSIRHNKIREECSYINQENMKRLQKKVPVTVSLSPGYNPNHNAFGLVSSITF